MNALNYLKSEVDINKIEKVICNEHFELDKEETFRLLEKTDMVDLLEDIEFIGKGFKIIVIDYNDMEEGYCKDFLYINTNNKIKNKIIPTTLTQTFYSKENDAYLPFKDETYMKEQRKRKKEQEKIRQKEREERNKRIRENIAKVSEEIETLPDRDLRLETFNHPSNNRCAYVIVDLKPGKYRVSIDEMYKDIFPNTYRVIDYIGYAGVINGRWELIASESSLSSDIVKEFVEKGLKERKMVRVIGFDSGRGMLPEPYDTMNREEILEMIVEELK